MSKKTIEAERQIIGGQRIGSWEVIIRNSGPGAPDTTTRMGFAFLTKAEAAAKRAEEALRLLPVSADAMDGTDVLYGAAGVFARIGQAQRAMDVLEELMAVPSSYSTAYLSLDPAFDSIPDDARYRVLLGG